jgi:hypothetical protein
VAGAKIAVNALGGRLEDFVETWLPEPTMDRSNVSRFREGRVRILLGRTAQARRLSLVQDSDAVITFKGIKMTAMVLDMALASNRPTLPLPFTKGDSETYWHGNRAQIKDWFLLDEQFATELEALKLQDLNDAEQRGLAERIRDAVLTAIRRECLVLMAYEPEPEAAYKSYIEPMIERTRFVPVRIDRAPDGGPIYESFLRSLSTCACVVADITELNPNVLYELGHVHARRLRNFVFARTKLAESALPFYLKPHYIKTMDGLSEFLEYARASASRA